ncbi:hypothetical protein F7725_019753 [Dissostichus mawsoni]|uniref:C2 domain-containing protein n=1 Tax=Dissostichus mawsoni TaxID=36200 RepID=A0A7J5YKM3_DISMA|nr:hypothetical protein F7725_019753 [Dissostichus mawsoni]
MWGLKRRSAFSKEGGFKRRREGGGGGRNKKKPMDLTFLQTLERERVLEVLRRDQQLRTIEEDRISTVSGPALAARGLWENCGTPERCAAAAATASAAGAADVKFRSGEWFLEERAKKFPCTTDKYEMVGDKLLTTYNVFSHISVVPPTPPPYLLSDYAFLSRHGDLKNSKPFTKSMEDLMDSFTSHIKNLLSVDNDQRGSKLSTQKSLSETDISKYSRLFKGPSLPNLFKKSKESDQEGSSTGAEEETSCGSEYSGGKRGSSCSILSTDCGLLESVSMDGELELALSYSSDSSCLEITVGYVKLCMLPGKSGKMKTAVKKNTTNPVYNEVFKFPIERHLLLGKRLQASVWHSGTLRRKVFLGEALFPLDGWRFEDKTSQSFNWYPLIHKASEGGAVERHGGEVLLRVKLSSSEQREVMQLSSFKSLQEKDTRRQII